MKLGTFLSALWARKPAHLRAGEWGERVAARQLERQGMKIIGRRVRVGRRDELDLVARDGKTLVFVEVKTRATEQFGRAIEAIDARKRKVLRRAARAYLRKVREQPEYFRFDVVEVVGSPEGTEPEIRHIPNAFSIHR
jgi:putative endonuclease